MFPKIYFHVADIYQQRWLEESGPRLENVDRTHLELASGKLVLQKRSPKVLQRDFFAYRQLIKKPNCSGQNVFKKQTIGWQFSSLAIL